MGTVSSNIYRGLALFDAIYYKLQPFGPAVSSAPGSGPWRPPQWSNGQPAISIVVPNFKTTEITFPASSPQFSGGPVSLPGAPSFTTQQSVPAPPTIYVFDGVVRAEHSHEMVITENPVQNGAPISDHMYRKPGRLVLEVRMSDAMQSFTPGQWSTNKSKSVSAFQTLVELGRTSTMFAVKTRLWNYNAMVVASVNSDDTHETAGGLKATVTLKEILGITITDVSSSWAPVFGSSSARQQTTDSTPSGVTIPQTVPAALTNQHQLTSSLESGFPSIPGAGNWSSTNISLLQG